MKKTFAFLISIIMIFSLIPMSTLSVSADGNEAIIVETGTEYATLKAAITAATSGQTVKLLQDVYTGVVQKGTYSSPKAVDLTIDFNNYTVYSGYTTLFSLVAGTAGAAHTITFENGGITQYADSRTDQTSATSGFDFGMFIFVNNNTDLVLDGMNITSGNFRQSYGYGAMITSNNNPSNINISVNNSTIADTADWATTYSANTNKNSENQCIGFNYCYANSNVAITLDNSTLLSQYSDPINNTSNATVVLKASHVTRVNNKLSANYYKLTSIPIGYYITDTVNGEAIESLINEDRTVAYASMSNYNEFYVYADNSEPVDPLAVDVTMITGASIRLNYKTGIRFYATVDQTKIATLKIQGATVSMGMLIAPADKVDSDQLSFDLDESSYLNVAFTSSEYFVDDTILPNGGIVGSIVDIIESNSYSATSGNITRNFIARAYVSVTLDGNTTISYADNTSVTSRSVQYISNAIIENEPTSSAYLSHKTDIDRWASAVK